MNAFFLDKKPGNDDLYIISNHFDEIEMPMIQTSYQYLAAALIGKDYESYLDFCKNSLGAQVVRKSGAKYASVYFKDTDNVRKFIAILNQNFERSYNYNKRKDK